MRIAFHLRRPAYLRLFESTIAELARRDHELTLVFTDPHRDMPDGPIATMLQRVRGLDGVSISDWRPELTKRRANEDPAFALRLWQDYLQYNEPAFADSPKLRSRAGEKLPERMRELSDALEGQPDLSRLLQVALGLGERLIVEPTAHVRDFLDEERPDMVVATMLVGRARQVDVVRAARRAGIPTAYVCASWDNLVTAGLLHAVPDTMAVWNEWQRDEATNLHRMPASAVSVTGAPGFDVWFDTSPSRDRDTWCREVGLDPDRRHLLYTCSSRFITEDESTYIGRWFAGLRAAGHPELEGVQLLVRPHPQNPLDTSRLTDIEGLVVQPPEVPLDERSRANYVDAIHHSAAVAGVNTSALIESAIFERSVHVHISKRYAATQTGTLHFRHLLEAGGGVLSATCSREEHYAGLAAAVDGGTAEATAAKAREFLTAFVRPHGLERPATPILADVLEQTGALEVAPNGSNPDLEWAADELRSFVEELW